MASSGNFSSELKTIAITILTLLSSMNLSIDDKLVLGSVFSYIGQIITLDSTFEAAELLEEEKTQTDVVALKEQVSYLTTQINYIQKQLKGETSQ